MKSALSSKSRIPNLHTSLILGNLTDSNSICRSAGAVFSSAYLLCVLRFMLSVSRDALPVISGSATGNISPAYTAFRISLNARAHQKHADCSCTIGSIILAAAAYVQTLCLPIETWACATIIPGLLSWASRFACIQLRMSASAGNVCTLCQQL